MLNNVLWLQPAWISNQHQRRKYFRGPLNNYSCTVSVQSSFWFLQKSQLFVFPKIM